MQRASLWHRIAWACPDCRRPLTAGTGAGLNCVGCEATTPIVDGIAFFPERRRADAADAVRNLLGTPADHHRFLLAKAGFPARDTYAAFHPFNESARTWAAFRDRLRALIRPGDLIVDLANRSGWTGEVLAGAFPDQVVLSLWAGNIDVLGYRGFHHWCGAPQRPANLMLAFLEPGAALPCPAGSARIVHGYDVLHRDPPGLLAEALRVATADGCILFPHVHTANGSPNPWFERDGVLLHGRDYRRLLDDLTVDSGRSGVLLGEAGLFEALDAPEPPLLTDASDTTDYNAVVAIVPSAWVGQPLASGPGLPAEPEAAALIANPLVTVDAIDGGVGLDDAFAVHLLPRHPVYARRLRARLPDRLDAQERLVLSWADRLPTLGAIAARCGLPAAQVVAIADRLRRGEVAAVQPISRHALRLLRHHASGRDLPFVDEDHPLLLWRRAVACFPERPYLVGDDASGTLTYADADAVVQALARRLARAGLGPGDAILIATGPGVEAVALFWAAMTRGVAVACCDPGWSRARAEAALAQVAPRLVFATGDTWAASGALQTCPDPGSGTAVPGWLPLTEWVEERDHAGEDATASLGEVAGTAVILFTTGSTGEPKGVRLSWAAMARSGRIVADHFRWSERDLLLSLGGLHTMSGLRNPCLAAVAAGAAVIAEEVCGPLAVADLVRRRGATLLGAAPATLLGLLTIADRLAADGLASLRAVLCTGSRLPPTLRERFSARFAVPVRNYYGLTETSGCCFGEDAAGASDGDGIGRPIDALARIVDEHGRDLPRGAVGELWIHNANRMLGYLGEPPGAVDPWYRTGDLARVEADGRCVLAGRLRELVKNSHGEIVACAEIEDALLTLPEVADAAVLSSRDGEGLEQACAWVVPADAVADPGPWLADLRTALHARLGAKRSPAVLLLRDAIPRSSNGKPRRDLLTATTGSR